MAAQMRLSAVSRSVNFLMGATPGIWFHNCTKRALGQSAVTRFRSSGLVNRLSPSAIAHRASAQSKM